MLMVWRQWRSQKSREKICRGGAGGQREAWGLHAGGGW